MSFHPKKQIAEAVDYALSIGWRLVKSGSHAHAWGRLYCPAQMRSGCIVMKTYEFDIVLKDVSSFTNEQADRLFAAGCDDGTPAVCDGVAWIHVDREAECLEDAIASAVAQVQAAGFRVSKVEMDLNAAVSRNA